MLNYQDRYKNAPVRPFELNKGIATARPFSVEKVIDTPDGKVQVTIRITTTDVDRTNDMMVPQGVRKNNYLANPVVLWNHDHSIPAIAQCLSLDIQPTHIDAVTEFHCETELSAQIAKLVKNGTLRTSSIGFIPIKGEEHPVTPEMIASGAAYPNISSICKYTEWELLEYSIVNVPMNQAALVQASVEELVQIEYVDSDGLSKVFTGFSANPNDYVSAKGDGTTTLEYIPAIHTPQKDLTQTPTTIQQSTENHMTEELNSQIETLAGQLAAALNDEGAEGYDNHALATLEVLAKASVKIAKTISINTETPEVLAIVKNVIKANGATVTAIAAQAGEEVAEEEVATDETEAPIEDPAAVEAALKSIQKAGAAISKENMATLTTIRDDAKNIFNNINGFIKAHSKPAAEEAAKSATPRTKLSDIKSDLLKSI